jgi:hypothetical protein
MVINSTISTNISSQMNPLNTKKTITHDIGNPGPDLFTLFIEETINLNKPKHGMN